MGSLIVLLGMKGWGEMPQDLEKRLQEHVQMLAVTLAPRYDGHVPNLLRAAEYIKREFRAAGGRVSEQEYFIEEFNQRNMEYQKGPYKNVIATFGPETSERLVVGAHYDTCGPYPGADDNASGTAVLIELAHRLGKDPTKIKTELVAYSTEEPPYFGTKHMGSYKHAESLAQAGAKVRAMICLESLGYFVDKKGSQSYPFLGMKLVYPSRGNFVAVVGLMGGGKLIRRVKRSFREGSGLPVESISAPSWVVGVDFSDHRSYWAFGYPAVMLTDTAFYRNRNYHRPTDTSETLDYKRMAAVVGGVRTALDELGR